MRRAKFPPNLSTCLEDCFLAAGSDHHALQRLKASIDRSIAEEQARSKPDTPGVQRTTSSAGSRRAQSPAQRSRPQRSGQDLPIEGAANPDPAIFEAAFVLDDSEDSRAGTPLPPTMSEDKGDDKLPGPKKAENAETTRQNGSDKEQPGAEESARHEKKPDKPATAGVEVSPEIRAKLRKLEKLEATYPGMSRLFLCILIRLRSNLRCCADHIRAATFLQDRPQPRNFHRALRASPQGTYQCHVN